MTVGLELARLSKHKDVLFLVSLFPEPPPTKEAASLVFLRCENQDPRCLCWGAIMHITDEGRGLIRKAAEGGYAWAEFMFSQQLHNDGSANIAREMALLEKAVAKGEPNAMSTLGCCLDLSSERERERRFLQEAAKLGDIAAQIDYATRCLCKDALEQFVWLRRAALQNSRTSIRLLIKAAMKQLQHYDSGRSGRIVFEIGHVFASNRDWRHRDSEQDVVWKRVMLLYNGWCSCAKQAVLCWLWLAKALGVSKDIRVLIANLIWDQKAAWSEHPCQP